MLALEHSDDPAKPFRLKGGLYQLFAEYISRDAFVRGESRSALDTHTQDRLKAVLTYIDAHYARRLSIKELAAEAGMSEGHFSRVFKSFMRRTPVEYINLQRIRTAAALLAERRTTVGEAALEAGFDNFSYFCKLFRSVFQCTPSEYRNRDRAVEQPPRRPYVRSGPPCVLLRRGASFGPDGVLASGRRR